MSILIQNRSFAGGEISPSLYSRVDAVKYQTGLRTCRNFLVPSEGGATNRPGSIFVGEVNDSTKHVRLIDFVFNADQTYCLEFGNLYMRVIREGVHVEETPQSITSIANGRPCILTVSSHGFTNGEEISISGVGGMLELNGRRFKVAEATADTFSLKDLSGTSVDSKDFGIYTSGGEVARIYTLVTPYVEADLPDLQYVQSADVMTLVHPSYAPRELSRTDHDAWSLSEITFAPSIAAPTGLATVGSLPGTDFQWKVTAVAAETYEESLPSDLVQAGDPAPSIDGICKSQEPVAGGSQSLTIDGDLTSAGAFSTPFNGRLITITSGGDIHERMFTVTGTDKDGNNISELIQGGNNATVAGIKHFKTVTIVQIDDDPGHPIQVGASTAEVFPLSLTWNAVTGAAEYNVYKAINGVYGLIGVAVGTTFEDTEITPDATDAPPTSRNPFSGAGNYPAAVTYFQQRRVFAAPNLHPETCYASRSGFYNNFTTSQPLQDDDAVTWTMAGRQVNRVKHLVEVGKLMVFTSGAEHVVEGNDAGILLPNAINPKAHTYNGSGRLAPIVISGNALYVQARGSTVRSQGFDVQIDGYRGDDMTTFSKHLFKGYTIEDWCYQQEPNSIVWAVRSDGTLLGLTHIKEQQIFAWHRHDFEDGFVENICSIPEGEEDAVYLVIRRVVDGRSVRYIERLSSRFISDIVDAVFLDSALSYDGRNFLSTRTMTLSGGSTWSHGETLTLTSSAAFFDANDVGNAIHLTDSEGTMIRASIEGFTSSTVVSVRPNRDVPASLQGVATALWSKAVDELLGLWHLEGKEVGVFADGFVVANPNNPSYTSCTVSQGRIQLDKPYSVIHVGLPITADLQTLDIDTAQGQTISDKKKLVSDVTLRLEASRGIWIGGADAEGEDLLEGLSELKIRNSEGYDEPVAPVTDTVNVMILPDWNSNGRVFVRQIDPLPLSILSIAPAGLFPFSTGGGS